MTNTPDNDRHEREWQPIETASAVGKKRLLFWTTYGRFVVGYRIAGTHMIRSEEGQNYIATHWMPLPPKPHHFNQEGK